MHNFRTFRCKNSSCHKASSVPRINIFPSTMFTHSAHAFFARACLCVLLHLGDDVDEAKIKKFPLGSYAANHWVDHAKLGCVSSDLQAGIMMKYLFDKALPHFKTWVWLYNVDTVARVNHSPRGTRCSPAVLRCAMWHP